MKINKRYQRSLRVRQKIKKSVCPRLAVFRSNKHIYAQIIDQRGRVLVSASEKDAKGAKTKMEKAAAVGAKLGQKAGTKIKKIVFDRGHYKYHGRVKALAEAARKAGLNF